MDDGSIENRRTCGSKTSRDRRNFLAEVVSTIPEPALVADESGTVVMGNDRASDVFGRELRSLQGVRFESLFSGMSRGGLEAAFDTDDKHATHHIEGENTWIELACDKHHVGDQEFFVFVLHDVTARHEREQTLEKYERIVETIDDGVYTLDESFTIETINSGVESMTGYDEADLVGSSATKLADESVINRATELAEELLSGDQDAATLTADLETADGDLLPVETRFSLSRMPNGRKSYVGVVRDISDRRRFEQTLTALHDSTRALLEAGTPAEVSQMVVDTALDLLDITGATIYLYDREDGVLRPMSTASQTHGGVDRPSVTPGDSPIWECFVTGEILTVGTNESDSQEGEVCLPLGSYGTLAVGIDAADEDTAKVLDMLAAGAEAALARVAREQSLWKRDEEIQERNRQLRRYKEVNTIIREIDKVLVHADTRQEIEQAVCDQLATSRWVSFAWIGRADGPELTPSAWAGDSPGYLEAVSLSTEGHDSPPAVEVARTDSTSVVSSIAEGLPNDHWRAEALSRNFQSVTSVPLNDDEFTYGVLSVYGNEPSVFGEMLQSVFSELGVTIANAIRDIESRQRRSSPTAVELELSVTAPTALSGQLANRVGSPLVFEGRVPEADDTTGLFFHLEREGMEPADVCDRSTELTRVESVTPMVSDEATTLFKAVVRGDTIVETLVERGARVDSIRAGPDSPELTVAVDLPSDVGIRELVELLADQYSGASLLARRERTVSDRSGSGIRTTLGDKLTDRQLQVLMTAYLSGFFEWPREKSGKELADKLDISQSTMSRHLRVSQQKLLDIVFDDM
jgi:PAS domain S-box-containing protein